MRKEDLLTALIAADNKRSRSQQTAIGVSQLGGCRKQVWLKLQGTEPTNQPMRIASIMGTSIHSTIEAALQDSGLMLEYRVEVDGFPPATIDCYDPATKTVTDFKTIKLSGVPYFITKQKRYQIHSYAFLLTKAGFEVDTVQLIGIPRDGNDSQLIEHSEPYDESIALEAFAWLAEVEAMTSAPAPEMSGSFCRDYCPFYGACLGKDKDLSGEAITDDVKAQAASDYVALSAQIKDLEKLQAAAKAELEGVSGVTFDGISVKWSEVRGRETLDADQVKFLLGDKTPMKYGATTYRLAVK
jgi:hypothetical protein